MNIRFKVDLRDYQMTSDKYQIVLNEVKVGQSGKREGEETFTNLGYYKTPFDALKSLADKIIYVSGCETFAELESYYKHVLKRLDAIADEFKLK